MAVAITGQEIAIVGIHQYRTLRKRMDVLHQPRPELITIDRARCFKHADHIRIVHGREIEVGATRHTLLGVVGEIRLILKLDERFSHNKAIADSDSDSWAAFNGRRRPVQCG